MANRDCAFHARFYPTRRLRYFGGPIPRQGMAPQEHNTKHSRLPCTSPGSPCWYIRCGSRRTRRDDHQKRESSALVEECFGYVEYAFACFIIVPDPLANACEIEPGGYVQWDEMDVGSLKACFPDKSRPCPHYDAVHTQSKAFFGTRQVMYR